MSAGRLSRGQPVVTWTRELRLALCLLAWAVVTVPFSLWPGGSVNVITELYSKSLIIFWLLGETVSSQRRFLAGRLAAGTTKRAARRDRGPQLS